MAEKIPPQPQDMLRESMPELEGFSLVLGGPLFQLFHKTHLDDVEKQVKLRILIISGILWIPLFLLCAIQGTLLRGIDMPFLVDVETHVRFLLSVPLLIYAELIVHQRIRGIVSQFVERGLVPAGSLPQFRKAINKSLAWRNSITAELFLMALVYTAGYYIRADTLSLDSSTWYATDSANGAALTLPGFWYFWVSNPVMQFLVLRWFYRILIWARFLWQVSRIELDLIPTHPDRNGGLGFLSAAANAYAPILTAMGTTLAGFVANRIFHDGTVLTAYKLEIVLLAAFSMAIVLGPLTVFAPQILAARRKGLREYGVFAAEYMREFDRRWLRSTDRDGEALLGSGDIQSLADLGNAFNVIKEMNAVPFNRNMFVQLITATAVPFVPLLFTVFPLEVILDRIIGVVF